MKIGILTLPLHTNYGGILQAYALQTVLERMGHEVVVYQKEIEPLYKLPLWKYPLAYFKRILQKLFVNRNQPILVEQKQKKEFPLTRQHTNRFIQEHIHTVSINKPSEIDLSQIDCIVVGSDQIWRPYHVYNLFKTDISEVFLDFAEKWNGKRIAYAVSLGVDCWEFDKEQTEKCKKLVRLFDAISVRELSAVKLCSDNLGIKVEHVLDPTFLLNKEDYIKLINESTVPKSDGQLFNYILDETVEKREFVEKMAEELGMQPYSMSIASWNIADPLDKRIAQPVEKWLRCFYDAEFVVTDSFHGCVFSIIFNKPFITIGNNKRGMSRFISLLNLFGMSNRLIINLATESLNMELFKQTFEDNRELKELRSKAYFYLETSIKK